MDWVNTIINGILLGGLYALFAAGLSLTFGVMRFINVAHGDFIIVAAFGALVLVSTLNLPIPIAALVIVPALAAAGYGAQRVVFNRVVGKDILPSILVTLGLSIIIQNLLLQTFSANSQRIQAGPIATAAIELPGGLALGILPAVMFLAAVVVLGGIQHFLQRTATGRILRATSDDADTVALVGANNAHTFAVATAIASGVVGIAGIFLSMASNFDPAAGPLRLLFAFEAVIIGGMGSLWGTLAGGIILGVAQAIGAKIDPGFQILAGHLAFLLILVFRPQGLFSRGFR